MTAGDARLIEDARDEDRESPGRRWTGLALLVAVLIAAALAGYLMFRPGAGDDAYDLAELPVIAPTPGAERERPVDEGGKAIPHRDVTVFGRMRAAGSSETVEQLLPHPERPLQPLPHERAEAAEAAEAVPWPQTPVPRDAEQLLRVERPVPVERPAVEAPPPPAETTEPEAPPRSIADLVREEGLADRPAETTEAPTASDRPAPRPQPEQQAAAPAEPAATAPAPTTDMSRSFRVQLAALRAESGARSEWERLRNAHRELLGDMRSHVVRSDLGERGVFYRLQAGPLDSRESAERLCAALRDRQIGCFVVAP